MANQQHIITLLILLTKYCICSINQCHSKLLDNCICGNVYHENEVMFMVNCTNQGFTNTDMLLELPEQTNMLIFTGNHIDTLPSNIFGVMANLDTLKIIDMSNNGIREIKGKSFHHVMAVKRLILNHNNIRAENVYHPRVFSNFYNLEELHLSNAFTDNTGAELAEVLHSIFISSNLTKLYKLHLEQNEITYFKDRNVFCDLPNIHDIYLANNNIPKLNFNIECLSKLRYLDLGNNNISQFSQNELNVFDKLAQPHRTNNLMIEINGNPLRCDSAIRNLYNWLHTTNVNVRDKEHLECHQSKFGNKYVLNLKNLAVAKRNKFRQAIIVLLAVLGLILFSLTTAYIYLRKDVVKGRFKPFLEAVTRKVQYTTIQSQDV